MKLYCRNDVSTDVKRSNMGESCNKEKSAKNSKGIFKLFYVTAYSHFLDNKYKWIEDLAF